jgi:hypothetical protein
MSEIVNFQGFIQDIRYHAYLAESLKSTPWSIFDINLHGSYGLIEFEDTEISYSSWVSPKRTRSYPFSRIYQTYNSAKKVTIIPVIKDEGKDGDRDRIQYSTFSWMSLLDIYIVLAYYSDAEPNLRSGKQKITHQKFDNEFVKSQIQDIKNYGRSANYWNQSLLNNRFTEIFKKALDEYEKISRKTKIELHPREGMDRYLKNIQNDFEEFKRISLESSQSASRREALTTHKLEYLSGKPKTTLSIIDHLGGIYYLTPDEILFDETEYIIQESKNTSRHALPSLNDILDGLFKLILFSNLDQLVLNNKPVLFSTRLNLTGMGIDGVLNLPASATIIKSFVNKNPILMKKINLINKLNQESQKNPKLRVIITGNK